MKKPIQEKKNKGINNNKNKFFIMFSLMYLQDSKLFIVSQVRNENVYMSALIKIYYFDKQLYIDI